MITSEKRETPHRTLNSYERALQLQLSALPYSERFEPYIAVDVVVSLQKNKIRNADLYEYPQM